MFGLLFWSSLWVVLLCEWLSQKNDSKFKKNIVLGATLPFEAHEDPQVQQILKQFKKKTDLVCLLLAIASVAGAFIPDMAISLICWSVMLVLDIVLPMGVYVLFNQKMKRLKKERGWNSPLKQQVRVDMSAMIDYPNPKVIEYLLAAALCVVPIALQPEMRWLHILCVGIVALSYCVAVFCYRRKSETVDGNQELTKTLSQLRYRMWNRIWVASAYCAVFISLSVWAMELSVPIGMSLMILTAIGFGGFVLVAEMQTRKLQEKLTAESGTEWYADEDDYWLGGLFYYNPNDSHMMVNARTGVNSTFNLASTGGKIITGFGVAILVGTMVLLVSLGLEDKSNIVLDTTEQTVYCENGSTRYEVPFGEIEQMELLNEMPEGLRRTNGLGGQHLCKGSFAGNGMPDLKMIADPTNPPYLKIKTTSGQYYLFGTRNPNVTESLFTDLNGMISTGNHLS